MISAGMAGCWLDGAYGWRNNARIVQLALNNGWAPEYEMEIRICVDAYYGLTQDIPAMDAWKAVTNQGGYAEQALDYLNTLAPEGYLFEWVDGDLMLWTEKESSDYHE